MINAHLFIYKCLGLTRGQILVWNSFWRFRGAAQQPSGGCWPASNLQVWLRLIVNTYVLTTTTVFYKKLISIYRYYLLLMIICNILVRYIRMLYCGALQLI